MKASNLNNILRLFEDVYGLFNLDIQFELGCIRRVFFWRVSGIMLLNRFDPSHSSANTKYFYGDGETIEEALSDFELKVIKIRLYHEHSC